MTIQQTEQGGWKLDHSYAMLPERLFTHLQPTPVQAPRLAIVNQPLAAELGLSAAQLMSEEGIAILSGNQLPNGALPLAQAYAGHQFGQFTMLGDGRAILLGEQLTPSYKRVDIQLKGSGPTPYSRGGDGRASLGPMLREYIMSEAMHALGIETSRSLAVVTTGSPVYRETELPGAILTRVASSHLRIGTFQYVAQWGTMEELRALADYAIERHYPHVEAEEEPYIAFFEAVLRAQAELVAKWQWVGFVHGVMNTDNVTISGETIDYGPCAFMDTYDPKTVFSSIDIQGRYAYSNQPPIMQWNVARFAEALLPLFHENQTEAIQRAEKCLHAFPTIYYSYWLKGMRAKLGLFTEETSDARLIDELLQWMHEAKVDYTNTFLDLTFNCLSHHSHYSTESFASWYTAWQKRLQQEGRSIDDVHQQMRTHNPAVIPRNHLVEEVIEAAVQRRDYEKLEQLLDVLSQPYAHTKEQQREHYTTPPARTTPFRTFCGT